MNPSKFSEYQLEKYKENKFPVLFCSGLEPQTLVNFSKFPTYQGQWLRILFSWRPRHTYDLKSYKTSKMARKLIPYYYLVAARSFKHSLTFKNSSNLKVSGYEFSFPGGSMFSHLKIV